MKFRDVVKLIDDKKRLQLAEVAVCLTLKEADEIAQAWINANPDMPPHTMFTCAAGWYYVVVFTGQFTEDKDVTQPNS